MGLSEAGHPEVVTVGLPVSAARAFLNDVAAQVREGRTFQAGQVAMDLTEPAAPIAFIEVVDTSELTAVEWLYGSIAALQLVWSNSSGRLPWDQGFDNPAEVQPLLGPRA